MESQKRPLASFPAGVTLSCMSGDLKFLGVRVPVETAERLRALAAMRSRSLNAEARVAVEAHLAHSARELRNDGGPGVDGSEPPERPQEATHVAGT